MPYKLLIAGKNNVIIDDFFAHMSNDFLMMTTSLRTLDVNTHIDMFEPDMFIYCLANETGDDYDRITSYKRKLSRMDINMTIIGSENDCNIFQNGTGNMADVVLKKPISIDTIRREIISYLDAVAYQREQASGIREHMQYLANEQRRKHVMIIDDDPLMLKLTKEYLHEKYDVATAVNGKIAYKFLETKKTDLILLDFEMPGENGPQVLENIRKKPELRDIPVIFLTGTTERQKISQALALKPQGYLLKPIDKEKLLGNIEKFLG